LRTPTIRILNLNLSDVSSMAQPVEDYDDWGDEVDSDDESGVHLDASEGIDAYAGHQCCYPVTVGEVIQGGGKSYRIEHKLGYGGFSTVWLAYDLEAHTSVTLKIQTASKAGKLVETEIGTHRDLHETIPEPVNLLVSLSTFILPGQSGNSHGVIVLPVMGPDLHTYLETCPQLDSFTALRLAKDILKAVACLHQNGFVHRGM